MSIDMDVVGVMAAYSDPLCVCVVHCIGRHSSECLPIHLMHNGSKYAVITLATFMSTNTIEPFL